MPLWEQLVQLNVQRWLGTQMAKWEAVELQIVV
jgi:hypothetical protein